MKCILEMTKFRYFSKIPLSQMGPAGGLAVYAFNSRGSHIYLRHGRLQLYLHLGPILILNIHDIKSREIFLYCFNTL